ncbi:hypothetical protein YC2023_041187 [Brassica napus]
MNQGHQEGRSTTPAPDHQTSNLEHEGGNETRTPNREETSREESSGSHDQAVESNDQQEEAEEGQLREEGAEASQPGEEERSEMLPQEEEQEMAQEGPMLRRSTRLRKDPSSWVNTRVYYNAQAVKHPTQAVSSFSQYPEAHCAFMVNLDEDHIPRSYEEAMEDKEWKESVGMRFKDIDDYLSLERIIEENKRLRDRLETNGES